MTEQAKKDKKEAAANKELEEFLAAAIWRKEGTH